MTIIVSHMLCFVSLQVDLPTVWHGLGRWKRCGIDELTFSCIISFALSTFVVFSLWVVAVFLLGPDPGCAAPLGGGTTAYLL